MKKTTVNTGTLAIANNAPDMVDLLRSELKKLTKVSETPFKTNGKLEGVANTTIDIKTETKIPVLISAMGVIILKAEAYDKGSEALKTSLGDTVPAFNISGGSVSEWQHDINLKISVIQYAERKAQLEELVREAETFMTKEDQFLAFQKRLASFVSK